MVHAILRKWDPELKNQELRNKLSNFLGKNKINPNNVKYYENKKTFEYLNKKDNSSTKFTFEYLNGKIKIYAINHDAILDLIGNTMSLSFFDSTGMHIVTNEDLHSKSFYHSFYDSEAVNYLFRKNGGFIFGDDFIMHADEESIMPDFSAHVEGEVAEQFATRNLFELISDHEKLENCMHGLIKDMGKSK